MQRSIFLDIIKLFIPCLMLFSCAEDGTDTSNNISDPAVNTAGASMNPTMTNPTNNAGNNDVPLSGNTAGTAAGTTAGNTAGNTAGTTAGNTAGTTAGADAGTSTVVEPMNDAGLCFQACLTLLSCETNISTTCGHQTQASWVSTCQQACEGDQANAIKTSAEQGCNMSNGVLSLLGLSCMADIACEESCANGQRCRSGGCTPWSCNADQFDAQGNESRETASMLNLNAQSLTNLTLCTEDKDWYQVDLPAGNSLRIDVAFLHADGDVDIKLYVDESETSFITALSSTNNERLTVVPSDVDRRLYLEVKLFSGGGGGIPGEPDEGMPAFKEIEYALFLSTNLPAPICQRSDNCQNGDICLETNVCAPPPPCMSNDDCPGGVCNLNTGLCIECALNDDCFSDNLCDVSTNECVDCLQDTDCSDGKLCDPSTKDCVECYDDSQCNDGTCSEQNRCLPSGCMDPLEPNNDQMSAYSVMTNNSIENIYVCGDRDWYTFNLNGGENVLISILFTDEDGDIDAKLYDSNAMELYSRLSVTDNEIFGLPNATAGQYFLEVYGLSSVTNTYSLYINTNSQDPVCADNMDCDGGECDIINSGLCLPPGYCMLHKECVDNTTYCNAGTERCEGCQNDTLGVSTEESPLSINNGSYSMLNLCNSPDFYSITANAGQTIIARSSFSHAQGDLDMRLTDPVREMTVSSALGTMDGETIEYEVETAGTYILKVYTVGNKYQDYDLDIQVQ